MKANTNDRRMMADALAWSTQQTGKNAGAFLPSNQTNPYLIVTLMLLLFAERTIAYKRNQ